MRSSNDFYYLSGVEEIILFLKIEGIIIFMWLKRGLLELIELRRN